MRIIIGRCSTTQDAWLILAALCMLFLPSSLMVLTGASSFSEGVLISSALSLAAYAMFCGRSSKVLDRHDRAAIAACFGALSFLVAHFLLVNGVVLPENRFSLDRYSSGMVGLSIMLAASYCAARYIRDLPDQDISKVVNWALLAVLVNVLFAASRIDFFGTGGIKPSFLFLEPSHIALMASPLILFAAAKASRLKKVLLITAVLAWGVYVQNLTTVIVAVVALCVCVRLNLILIGMLGSVLLYAGYLLIDLSNFGYFMDRLNISPNSENLSVLVFMQGWDNARLTLEATHGLGAGFQQLGVFTDMGQYSAKVLEISGSYVNRYDGGTTGAKIVSEFGYAGIALLAAHLLFVAHCFFKLRSQVRSGSSGSILSFAYCTVLCSSLEIYFRGAGYFTPLMFVTLMSIFIVGASRKKKPILIFR